MHPIIDITGLAHGGYGVCRIEGQACFVPYALPGDRVRVRVVQRTKGVLWGAIEEVIEPSPHRGAVPCDVFGACGGCTWLHFAYPAQAEWKRRIVADCLARIGGVACEVSWAEDAGLRLGYRTRAEFHGDGGSVGFFAQASHDIVDVPQCPLCHPKLNAVLATLRTIKPRASVEITVHPESDDVLVWTPKPHQALAAAFPDAQSARDGARASFLFDGVPVVNGTFAQSSLLLNRVLVRMVHEMLDSPPRVLDLYCGSGNLSLRLPELVEVLGFDHNQAAIDAANALRPKAYRAGDEASFTKALRKEAWDAVILDPPRTGAKTITDVLCNCTARRIVYVSCDPATLARDVKALTQAGWRLTRATAVDLFPQTCHIETVCLLERQ